MVTVALGMALPEGSRNTPEMRALNSCPKAQKHVRQITQNNRRPLSVGIGYLFF
jgi:hypothetical protein